MSTNECGERNVNELEGATEFLAVLKRTNTQQPDPADLVDLRKHLERFPQAARELGDLSRVMANRIIDELTSTGYLREALRTKYALMIKELSGEPSTALEKLLCEQVALCWLRLQVTEHQYQNNSTSKEIVVLEFVDRRLSAAQRRFLRAVETLARVRRLGINVQINVANTCIRKA